VVRLKQTTKLYLCCYGHLAQKRWNYWARLIHSCAQHIVRTLLRQPNSQDLVSYICLASALQVWIRVAYPRVCVIPVKGVLKEECESIGNCVATIYLCAWTGTNCLTLQLRIVQSAKRQLGRRIWNNRNNTCNFICYWSWTISSHAESLWDLAWTLANQLDHVYGCRRDQWCAERFVSRDANERIY